MVPQFTFRAISNIYGLISNSVLFYFVLYARSATNIIHSCVIYMENLDRAHHRCFPTVGETVPLACVAVVTK